MNEQPNPCPRCGSEMEIKVIHGNMRSWPEVILRCSGKGCMWNMGVLYDDLGGETADDVKGNLIKQWNEGTGK